MMRPHSATPRLAALATIVATLLTAACEGPTVVNPEEGLAFHRGQEKFGSQTDLVKSVRQATARFHSTVQAAKAGYLADPFCVSVPGLGTMGYHWANSTLIDPDFDPLQPETILYAPDRNGNLKLVAVEYVVVDIGQPRPSFEGQLFDVGGVPPLEQAGVRHWSLHVWLWEHNPSGMFAPFNPNLSCG